MASLQTAVKTNNAEILYEMIVGQLSDTEKNSRDLITAIQSMSNDLVELHKNNWDGIWIRIATNFMLIARLQEFDLIVGNPPWHIDTIPLPLFLYSRLFQIYHKLQHLQQNQHLDYHHLYL